MPRALITGVTGQDGSYLVDQLQDAGWDLHALVRQETADGEQAPAASVAEHVGDLDDPESLRAIVAEVEPDVIFNLGGISSVARSWQEPEATARISGLSVGILLEAAWKLHDAGHPVRLIQASSSEIFGLAADQPQSESTPIAPVSPYGAAKALAHHLVRVYRERGMFASSAILYNHESPRRPTAFVTRKITAGAADIAAGRADSLSLGNLDVQRDWGWAPDYVDAMVRMATADAPADFVVATGVVHSVREFVAAAFTAAGIDDWEPLVTIDPRFARPVETPTMRGDASLIRSTLGWQPTVGFEDLVAQMVRHDLSPAE